MARVARRVGRIEVVDADGITRTLFEGVMRTELIRFDVMDSVEACGDIPQGCDQIGLPRRDIGTGHD